MHQEVRGSLTKALRGAIDSTVKPVAESVGHFSAWRKAGPGSWEGVTTERPRLGYVMFHSIIGSASAGFAEAFSGHYPEYSSLVGFSGMRMALGPESVFSSLVRTLWERSWPETPGDTEIEAIVGEFADFLRDSTVTINYYAPIHNFDMPDELEALDLPTGTRIKRLDDDELAMLFGVWGEQPPMMFQQNQFAFVGEYEEEKKLGPMPGGEKTTGEMPRQAIRLTLVGMKCFKPGGIDFAWIRLHTRKFVPFTLGTEGRHDGTPLQTYKLKLDDVEQLREHLRHFVTTPHRSLELACSRLAQAAGRRQEIDKLLDAVIGLEAVLLYSQSQELSYRFALNYSTLLQAPEERFAAFEKARNVYRVRSKVSHGGDVAQAKLRDAASDACEMLRRVIKTFVPYGTTPPYLTKTKRYWDQAILHVTKPEG